MNPRLLKYFSKCFQFISHIGNLILISSLLYGTERVNIAVGRTGGVRGKREGGGEGEHAAVSVPLAL